MLNVTETQRLTAIPSFGIFLI